MSGLTVTEVFDLLAEHAECWCPADRARCPQHNALKQAAATEVVHADGYDGITDDMLPMDQLSGYTSQINDDTPRVVIAVLLWRVVAEFVAEEIPLYAEDGETLTEVAEDYVRDNGDLAQTMVGRIKADNASGWEPIHIDELIARLGLTAHFNRITQEVVAR